MNELFDSFALWFPLMLCAYLLGRHQNSNKNERPQNVDIWRGDTVHHGTADWVCRVHDVNRALGAVAISDIKGGPVIVVRIESLRKTTP